MQILQNLNLRTLEGMLNRHSEYYSRMLTEGATDRQRIAGKRVITIIQEEIDLRKAKLEITGIEKNIS